MDLINLINYPHTSHAWWWWWGGGGGSWSYFAWRRHGRTSAWTESRVNDNYQRTAPWCGAWFRNHEPESEGHLSSPTLVAGVLAIRPRPIRQNRLAPAVWSNTHYSPRQRTDQCGKYPHLAPHIWHRRKAIILYAGDINEDRFPCTGTKINGRVNANYERIAWWGAWLRNHDLQITETPFVSHSGGQHGHNCEPTRMESLSDLLRPGTGL